MEEWKQIRTTTRRNYFISNYGRVKSVSKHGVERMLRPGGRDYLSVQLGFCGGITIHHQVALFFVDNPYSYTEVDHIDGNKHNNHHTNLRWVNRHQQLLNTKIRTDNTSGVRGVSFHNQGDGLWSAFWSVDGKMHRRYFKTKDEAIDCRKQMEAQYYEPEFYNQGV